MNMGFWTIRGLNNSSKQQEIKWFLHNNKVGLFGLLGTRVKALKAMKVCCGLDSNWSITTNYASHPRGRIWLLWNPFIYDVDVIFQSSQIIHCYITHKTLSRSFDCSYVYGFNDEAHRSQSWIDLKMLAT